VRGDHDPLGNDPPCNGFDDFFTRRVIDRVTPTADDVRMTNTDTIPELTTIVDLHLAAYCEPDGERRAELIAAAWQPDGVLLDPPFDGSGHDGIAALTDAVLAHFPGHTFRRVSAVDAHHDVARYRWELVGPDGAVAVAGTDVVETRDGLLARVVGFFGEPA
jgi:hypothetical protein